MGTEPAKMSGKTKGGNGILGFYDSLLRDFPVFGFFGGLWVGESMKD